MDLAGLNINNVNSCDDVHNELVIIYCSLSTIIELSEKKALLSNNDTIIKKHINATIYANGSLEQLFTM